MGERDRMLGDLLVLYGRCMTAHQVAVEIGVSRSKLNRLVRDNRLNFPAPVHLGANTARWRAVDVVDWLRRP